MKQLFLPLLFIGFTVKSMAQVVITPKGTKVLIDSSKWLMSGDNILNKNPGNIGIGTSSPTAKLHTKGQLRLEGLGTTTSNTNILTTDGSGNVTTRELSNLLSGNIIQSNTLALSNGFLTSTINSMTSNAVSILSTAENGLMVSNGKVQLGGPLLQPTTITTGATNTLSLTGLQTGSSSDSVLVSATGGVIKRVPFPVSSSSGLVQLIVDARKTGAYSTAAAYLALVYNTAGVNVGSAYNTSTGLFTAPVTGLYEIIVNNCYSWGNSSCAIANQIIVNGTIDMEKSITSSSNATNSIATISGNTVVSLMAGQTVSITVGGLIGNVTPQVGAGQHVLKILRL